MNLGELSSKSIVLCNFRQNKVIGGAESNLPLEHLGLLYLKNYCEQLGMTVIIKDGEVENLSGGEIFQFLINTCPLIIGFSPGQNTMEETLGMVRKLAGCLPSTTFVVGGHHVSSMAREIIEDNPEVDVVVRGEGEIPFSKLAGSILRGEDWRKKRIPGFVYRNGNTIWETGKSPVVEMDSLPQIGECQLDESGEVALISSRGCQSNCAFCASPRFSRLSQGPCWRVQSPEHIVDEIEDLKRKAELRNLSIHFHDPDFVGTNNCGINRAMRVADLLIKRRVKAHIRFTCQARTARRAGREFWRLWKRAGLVKVYVGFESGLDSELRRSHKASTVLDNLAAFEIIKSSGVALQIGFIMFNPHSSSQTIQENLSFLSKVDQAHIFKHVAASLDVYPGTDYFDTLCRARLLEFEKPYLEVKVLYRDESIWELKETLCEYRENQYPQDCLCLDLDFALSAGETQVQTLGYMVDMSPATTRKYLLYRQNRGKTIQSLVRKMLFKKGRELICWVEALDEQLTLAHREFLRSVSLK